MSFDLARLWELVPSIYRIRDGEIAARTPGVLDAAESAELASLRARPVATLSAAEAERMLRLEAKSSTGPLRALLGILGEQIAVLEEDLAQLHDDHFIETCAEWVVPYIGDLVGARLHVPIPNGAFSRRAYVADTIKLRRSKGTRYALERLGRDVTGWDVTVVEYFRLLATTQYLNHLRPRNLGFASLRSAALAESGTPFDRTTRTADVRSIERGTGTHNIPNVGIWLWRIAAHPMNGTPAYAVDATSSRRFTFDPLGLSVPLFNRRDDRVTDSFENPLGVPRPISRRAMAADLAKFYGRGRSLLVTIAGTEVDAAADGSGPPLADLIEVCDLRDVDDGSGGTTWAHPTATTTRVRIDPELGRIVTPTAGTDVRVSYHYGLPAEIGGGEYERGATFDDTDAAIIAVPDRESTINAAITRLLQMWAAGGAFRRGVVEITRNDLFVEPFALELPDGKTLEIRAADGKRPVVVLDGAPAVAAGGESSLVFNGLLLAGAPLTVPATLVSGAANRLGLLRFTHCTLAPRQPSRIGTWTNSSSETARVILGPEDARLELDRCISGPLRIAPGAEARIDGSIVDAGRFTAKAFESGPLEIRNSTVIGRVDTRILRLASNTIFAAKSTASGPPANDAAAPAVRAERLQEGCVRFSYVPDGSRVPRRFQCVPRSGIDAEPFFTSLTFGHPAYGQLARNSAAEIRTGADDEAEMGLYHDLYQPQREANLRALLDEYLRFGLEAGVFHAS